MTNKFLYHHPERFNFFGRGKNSDPYAHASIIARENAHTPSCPIMGK